MDLTPYKSSKTQNGGPLKTTTWGALIAIALLLGLLGTTGHLLHSFGSAQLIQTAANTAPGQNASAPVARKHSYNNASGLGLNNPLTFEQPGGVRA
ncbi:MAG TPA: hypothetical protein VN087_11175, partial [Verrucomicrobiae bacterium]|nr:hypothetical protein [Verrucomicrobiae bacterium]